MVWPLIWTEFENSFSASIITRLTTTDKIIFKYITQKVEADPKQVWLFYVVIQKLISLIIRYYKIII